jgi:outer membrane protein
MKKAVPLFTLLVLLIFQSAAHALPVIDVEAAIGAWMQIPSGSLSYPAAGSDDTLTIEDDLNYETETRFCGRLSVDLPIVPTLYLIAAPMEFEGEGQKEFFWNGLPISSEYPFFSRLTLNQYDVTLYYSLPLLNLATLGALTIDLGLNGRIMDVEVMVEQERNSRVDSQSFNLLVPMIYAAVKLAPGDTWSIEAELRGMSYSHNSIYSLIARLKAKIFGPAFATGGYRYDAIDIDEQGVRVDASFSGPFIEAGVQF